MRRCKRRPAILVVDELAHSNLIDGDPPPRHAKRWQDIEELLEQGINVWTTVNVQHLESLNDLVAQITGVRQRETIPDRIFDEADEVELIDLPPDDLIARLKAGKVYVPEQVATAIDRFFRKSNLIALRELALRRVADRVDAAARASVLADRTSRAWMARDRVLVAIGPDDQAEQVVRAGKRVADALDAQWTVVYVETPDLLRLSTAERNRRIDLLRLAESLGAETVTLDGPSAAQVLLEYARTRNATRLVIGAPKRRGWRAWLRPSTTTEVVRKARGFDVITIGVDRPGAPGGAARSAVCRPRRRCRCIGIATRWALATTLICTAVAFAMYPYFELANIVMAYVLGSTIAGVRFGRGPAIVAAIANVLAFDFFFVPPRFTFSVADFQYLVTFAVMLIVTLVIANLMASVRQQTRVAGARERRTALLYAMSRELAATRGVASMARSRSGTSPKCSTARQSCCCRMRMDDCTIPAKRRSKDRSSRRTCRSRNGSSITASAPDSAPIRCRLRRPCMCRLSDERQRLGVLAVLPENRAAHSAAGAAAPAGDLRRTARTGDGACAAGRAGGDGARGRGDREPAQHAARLDLARPAHAARGDRRREQHTRRAWRRSRRGSRAPSLARSIETKARDMSELVSNVLDLMRFESGQIALRRDWDTLDDLIGSALARVEERLREHPVNVDLPPDLPPVHVDADLIVQVFANLLDNVAKYTPPGTARPHLCARAMTIACA